MNTEDFKKLLQAIVEKAHKLKNKYTTEINAPVNYACIFSHSKEEYDGLVEFVQTVGKIIKKTPTGLLFQITPIETIAGKLQILKIRFPDITRPECGDADFTVTLFSDFKKKYLTKKGFKLTPQQWSGITNA